MASFFYDGEKGERNFTSVEAARSCYIVCNPTTKNLRLLPPSIHAVGQARLGFDLTASSHFHVIEFVEEEDVECLGVEFYSSNYSMDLSGI